MYDLDKLRRRLPEILQEQREIDEAETSAGRNFLENDRYRALQTEDQQIRGQIEVAESIEAERDRRRQDADRIEQRRREQQGSHLQDPDSGQRRTTPTGPFKTLGEQLQAVIRSSKPGGVPDPRLLEVRAPTGLSESVGEDGGLLVQTDFASTIWQRVYQQGQIVSRCRRIPISSGANGIRWPRVKESSRVTGSRWGGVQAYWRSEAGLYAGSKPSLDEFKIELEKLTALVYLTDEIAQDAAQLETLVREVVPQEMTFTIEDAILRGNGVGQPLGILNAGCLVTVSKEGSQAADTIVPENIVKMDTRAYGSSMGYVWLINQDVKPQLYLMVKTDGASYGVPVYMPANGLAGAQFSTLMGRPVIPVEYCSTLGDVGDIFLADFSQYVLIEKGGIDIASSIHVQFLYGEQVLRFTYRLNGAPAWSSALTPYKGSSTQSPFVTLQAR